MRNREEVKEISLKDQTHIAFVTDEPTARLPYPITFIYINETLLHLSKEHTIRYSKQEIPKILKKLNNWIKRNIVKVLAIIDKEEITKLLREMTVECIKCKGTGKIKVTAHYMKDSVQVVSSSDLTCVHCNGTTRLLNKELENIKKFDSSFCECDNRENPKYYADGEHKDLYKHHWRCSGCDGVIQIG